MIRQEAPTIGTAIALSRLKIAEDFITIPISLWDTQRRRRGVFNGIGSAMKFLFGTATDSEMQEVRVTLDEMRRNQDTTLHWIDQFTVTINHTYAEIQINRDHINLLIKEVKGIFSEVNNGLSGVLGQIRMVRNQQAIGELVTQMLLSAQQYARSCYHWQQRKTHLEAGRLTETLLPPTTLKELLASVLFQTGRIVQPLQWYYEKSPVTPVWTDNVLIYRAKLPLMSPEQWHFVTITT